jgi:hypothetical protein
VNRFEEALMDAPILLPLPYEDAATPIRARRLLVHVSASDDEAGLVIRRSLVAAGTLTAVQEESENFDFLRQQYVTTWLTRDNPFLTDEQRDRLDERGLIPLHTLLRPKDILASVLSTAIPNADRPPYKGKVWVNDASWETPANWVQTRVTHIQLFGGKDVPKGVRQGSTSHALIGRRVGDRRFSFTGSSRGCPRAEPFTN